MSSKWGDLIPQVKPLDKDRDAWFVHGVPDQRQGVAIVHGALPDRTKMPSKWEEVPEITYVPEERVKAMDRDGVDVHTFFGNVAGVAGATFSDPAFEEEYRLEAIRAFNDFQIEAYAKPFPGRFITLALVPLWDVDAAVAEVLRTRARAVEGGYLLRGRKIWTSWAAYATWCLVLARTGTPDSRHRGLTAFIVDLREPGVEVTAIEQANGTDELAEVALDDVFVSADRVVGSVDGGWAVAMHILSSERGTFAWFRHGFLYQQLLNHLDHAQPCSDAAVGEAVLDLAAVSATSYHGLEDHEADMPLGPRAAFTKLLLCEAERSVHDRILADDADFAVGVQDDETACLRQDYLFSRIVTVYGGSQQMQLETIAKQLLQLP